MALIDIVPNEPSVAPVTGMLMPADSRVTAVEAAEPEVNADTVVDSIDWTVITPPAPPPTEGEVMPAAAALMASADERVVVTVWVADIRVVLPVVLARASVLVEVLAGRLRRLRCAMRGLTGPPSDFE
jgi:hypothetical protein